MCGIYGCITKDETLGRLYMQSASENMLHRGPDDQNYHCLKPDSSEYYVFLGINRLVINNKISGIQPYISDLGRYLMVFNGEIFNHQQIRQELKSKGYQINTQKSEADTIGVGYKAKGIDIFNELNGMFAIAIFDKVTNNLDLAVDFPGMKNLLVTSNKNELFFASELSAIISMKGRHYEIDTQSVDRFLGTGFIQAPFTIYKNVIRLSQGRLLRASIGKSIKLKYQQIILNQTTEKYTNNESTLEDILVRSTRRWLMSDYPISSLISGGIDSALISAIASKDHQISTFCFGFSDNHLNSFNEIEEAKITAQYIGAEFNEVVISQQMFFDCLRDSLLIHAEPFAGSIPSYFLFKEISKRFRVTLTGHGGDEIFGNYGRQPIFNNSGQIDLAKTYFQLYSSQAPNIFSHDIFEEQARNIQKSNFYYNDLFSFELHNQLTNDFLRYNDIYSMRFSVESRSPFLDKELISLRLKKPEMFMSSNIYDPKEKLRQIAKHYLPTESIHRSKKGLTFPFSFGLRDGLFDCDLDYIIDKLMLDDLISKHNNYYLKNVIQQFNTGNNKDLELIWRIICLWVWYQNYNE